MGARKTSVFILSAAKGDVRAARSLMGRALREVLGVKRLHVAPHFVTYDSQAAARAEGSQDPRYYADLTEEEFAAVGQRVYQLSQMGGWDRAPIDAYRD